MSSLPETRGCQPATQGRASMPCCRARTRPRRTPRPGPPSTLPRCALPFSGALRLSTPVRVGVCRRLWGGS
eukprot:4314095-Alexandrium_andersonii.AAC.1